MAYNKLDQKLVNALIGNGRESLRSLGEELDVSVTTVSNHIEALEASGGVKGYTPIIDYSKFGYNVTAIMHLKVEGTALNEIVETLKNQHNIISVYETTGDYDIISIGKFRDTTEMNEQIKDVLSEVDVRESNTSVVLNAAQENKQFELPTDDE